MKRFYLWMSLLSLLFFSPFAMALPPLNWSPALLVGYGVTNADTQQTIRLANTPAPGLSNRYLGATTLYGSALFGFALENLINNVGFEFDYLRNNAINGTVEPLVNVSPNFDELKYSYDLQTFILQATLKLIRQNIWKNFDGYLQGGLGIAMNRLSNYEEYAPTSSTAAPMLAPFGNKNTLNAALSFGVGVTHKISKNNRFFLGYRYIYSGRAKLGTSPVQQTNSSIELSPISYQLLIFELQFGNV